MFLTSLFLMILGFKYLFPEEQYSDILLREYNKRCYDYYSEKMRLIDAPEITKKEASKKDEDSLFWAQMENTLDTSALN